MALILSHFGSELPNHLNECLEQTRKFYSGEIYLITNCSCDEITEKYQLNVSTPDFSNIKYVELQKVNFNPYPSKDFWKFSLARFFFIEDLVCKLKLENFIVYENDILIYYDLKNIIDKLSSIKSRVFFTVGDDTRVTTGFSFFKSYLDLVELNNLILQIINDEKKMEDIKINYSPCCPSEMVFIRKISKETNFIKPLPLFPENEYFTELGFVFDPASYGQYLGGTSVEAGDKPNFIDDITYIGKKLLNKEIEVSFNKESGPILIQNNKEYKIFNLHIHSKKLKNFI